MYDTDWNELLFNFFLHLFLICRDQLTKRINEQEKLSRQLKDNQRIVKENQVYRLQQMKLWTDLQK